MHHWRKGWVSWKTQRFAYYTRYKRQYIITKSFYMKIGGLEGGGSISTVASCLEQEIHNTLHSDQWLVGQLERLTINSRVKQQLKKKTMKLRKKEKCNDYDKSMVVAERIPSLSQVLDAIALRVIVKAKAIGDETEESKRVLMLLHTESADDYVAYN